MDLPSQVQADRVSPASGDSVSFPTITESVPLSHLVPVWGWLSAFVSLEVAEKSAFTVHLSATSEPHSLGAGAAEPFLSTNKSLKAQQSHREAIETTLSASKRRRKDGEAEGKEGWQICVQRKDQKHLSL